MKLADVKERIHTHTRTHAHAHVHIHTHTPYSFTCAIIWQNEFFKCCKILKYVRNIVKISICLVLQIIVYKDRLLHGLEQIQK